MKTSKNTNKRGIYIILFLVQFISGFSQKDLLTQENSITIIRRGIELQDEKKNDEAIAEFKKVHRNDSNYYLAAVELLNSYLDSDKDSLGLAYCNHLLTLKNDYTPNILVFKGDFLDKLKRFDEAEAVFLQGQKDYPLNNSFFYELGVSKYRRKKYSEAYDWFVKSLKVNPMHALSHYQMGILAHRQNNITASMLAIQFYLLCDVRSKRAVSLVGDLEKISKLELESDSTISIPQFDNENDFTELESIIKSKVALSDKYKSKTDLDYNVVKQMQLVIENIGKYKEVKGFYNEFYGKFFSELYAQKHFEPYVYFALSGMEIDKVKRWMEKNKSEVNKFETWTYDYICGTLGNFSENLNGKTINVPHYYSDNRIFAAGQRNPKNENEGYWNYYYSNGIKKAEGEFKNGLKDGLWKYYFKTGGIKEESVFENGVEKTYRSFYSNNNIKVEFNLVNNKIEGEIKYYYQNGNLRYIRNYKDGKISGQETQFYRNGNKNYVINNFDNIYEGDLVEYYDNGKPNLKYKLVKSKRQGPSQEFFNNDNNTLSAEGSYIDNKYSGEWKYYHKNGKIYSQGSFNSDGLKTGEWKVYYDSGILSYVEIYDNGKLNGLQKYNDYDGVLWQEYVYKKGKIYEYRAYKKDGSSICNYKVNGKNFKLILYHPNGVKRREGDISDGELDGVWKDYSTFGALLSETNYKEGKYEGKYIKYHNNGKPENESIYENDNRNGYYTSYFINGNVESEGMMVQGSKEGYWKYYKKDKTIDRIYYYSGNEADGWNEFYDANGKLEREELYNETCLIKVVYYDTLGNVKQNIDLPKGSGVLEKKNLAGKLVFHKEFLKDYAEGDAKEYYADGTLESVVKFVKGKREGKYITYDELARKTMESDYFNDEIDGKKIEYYDDGKVSSDFVYDNGDYHGKSLVYHENGKVYKELNYYFGDLQGESPMYDEFGELIIKRNFYKDFLVNFTYKDASGNFVKPMELPAGDYKAVCYFQNGKKSIEANYNNGELNGKRLIYFSNGKLYTEDDFYYGSSINSSKEYYSNGNLKSNENYNYGSIDGKCEYFYENGKIKLVMNFKCGDRHGWTIYYDQTGKPVKSIWYYNNESIFVK